MVDSERSLLVRRCRFHRLQAGGTLLQHSCPIGPPDNLSSVAPRSANRNMKSFDTTGFGEVCFTFFWPGFHSRSSAQPRVYRFGDTSFDRIRPDSRLVRDTFAYKDIAAMTMRADDYLVITFNNGKEAQHMQSPFASVIRDLVLLRLKALAADE